MRGSETMSYQIKAALWMSGAIASFIAMSIAGRAVQAELNTFELMFWRSLVGLVLICALVLAHRRPLRLRPTRPGCTHCAIWCISPGRIYGSSR